MITKNDIHRLIVRTPFHKMALEMNALKVSNGWIKEKNKILGHKTIYSISPYKTGTTFLASSFNSSISKHEPSHHTSVWKLNQDFEGFFIRRLNTLNLKLECSGFLSAHIDKIAKIEILNDLEYICILRKPSSWVTSVINHWQTLKRHRQYYFWSNELFWKKHIDVDLAFFFESSEKSQKETIEKLLSFYMSFTQKTTLLKNVHYIWIENLKSFLPELGKLINEEVIPEKSKRNKALMHQFKYSNKKIDEIYTKLAQQLIEGNVI